MAHEDERVSASSTPTVERQTAQYSTKCRYKVGTKVKSQTVCKGRKHMSPCSIAVTATCDRNQMTSCACICASLRQSASAERYATRLTSVLCWSHDPTVKHIKAYQVMC